MKGNRLLPLFLTLIIALGISLCITYSPKAPVPSYDYLYPVKFNKKVGFIDETGEVVIRPEYDMDNYKILTKGTKYIAVRSNGKIGYINMNGEFVIEPQYDKAANIYENSELTMVSIDGKYGFINSEGKEVIPLKFDDASSTFSEGLCAVKSGKQWGFINENGEFVIEPQFDEAKNFTSDNTMVKKDGLWGLINKKGEFIIDPKFEQIEYDDMYYMSLPSEERSLTPFPVQADGKWGYIDLSGKIVISPEYKYASKASEGILVVTYDKSSWKLLDYTGKELLSLDNYSFISSFTEDKAIVCKDDKFGAINKSGEMVIPNEYDDLSSFLENKAIVIKDKKYGYINADNEKVIDCKFDWADYFINGVAQVAIDLPDGAKGGDFRQGKIGYINKEGNYIFEPSE